MDERRILGSCEADSARVIQPGDIMNRDEVKGTLNDALGKVQEHAGKTIGSNQQQAKGLLRQSEGRMQKAYGHLKAALKNSQHS